MNNKMRAVIIDDEETAIDNLCFELKKYQWISVEGIACNGKAGIRLIEKERPDLLFLDVELPDMRGWIWLSRCMNSRTGICISCFTLHTTSI